MKYIVGLNIHCVTTISMIYYAYCLLLVWASIICLTDVAISFRVDKTGQNYASISINMLLVHNPGKIPI